MVDALACGSDGGCGCIAFVQVGVCASGRVADGFADVLWMGLMRIEADGFDADGLWMGLMQMRLRTGCGWV